LISCGRKSAQAEACATKTVVDLRQDPYECSV
jgi:hypothetical protein